MPTIISKESVTLRQFIKHHFPHIRYTTLQQGIRKGGIRVNNMKLSPQAIVNPGDKVKVVDGLAESGPIKPHAGHIERVKVIDSNPDFIVVDKPFGIPTQGGTNVRLCMVDIIESMIGKKAYIVHRLDRYTTGLMVFATHSYAARDLSESISTWRKVYHALLENNLQQHEGQIESEVDGKRAVSDFRRIKDNLVEFTLLTGRKHQIRQHAAYELRNPVKGDVRYGSNTKTPMYLRCVKLDLTFRGKRYQYQISQDAS
jgi:23S rRNA-/tRNA-specific pseudouridylate synthase